jgi:hypothetical protein
MPAGTDWRPTRAELWNAVEAKNRRADAQVAREFVVALPAELSPAERRGLGNKARELDLVAHNMGGQVGQVNAIERLRARWAELTNARLREAGLEARVDHRRLEAQGLERAPTRHLGPAATGIERRTGAPSRKRLDFEQEASERRARAQALGELECQGQRLERAINGLCGELEAARRERDHRLAAEVKQVARAGKAEFRTQFERHRRVERGKQQAREAFQRLKAELARQPAAKRAAQERVRPRQEAERQPAEERQRQVEERREPRRTRGPRFER